MANIPNNQQLISVLLEEFYQKIERISLIPREFSFPKIENKIKVAIGMRRSGKTYFLLQQILNLLKEKVPKHRILYLNFEDDRLLPLVTEKLASLVESFYSYYPDNHDHLCYLFFDEIQNVENWSLVIRRLFDTKNVEIFLSGSSAKLLSTEIATSLRGRSISLEVFPFSFSEYCTAKKINKPEKPFGKKSLDQFNPHLTDYLIHGGFPEIVSLNLPDRRQILRDYVNIVIARDIVERNHLNNYTLIRYFINTLIKNAGTTFSFNKFFNDLKSQGMSLGKSTLYDYFSYIEDAFLAFKVPLFSESLRKIQSNPQKIYTVDTGLIHTYTTQFSQNLGHMFENLIYLDLRRKGHEIYHYLTKERYEIDFLTLDKTGKQHLYQVAWDTSNQDTLAREERALKQAEKELNIKGKVITPETYLLNHLNEK